MWRPCVWPPESEADAINCSGGKLVAYVYHMGKVNTCGDDFEYSNNVWAREYSTLNQPVISKNFFQPNPDEWYTVWSHIQMNTAGMLAFLSFISLRDCACSVTTSLQAIQKVTVADVPSTLM